MKLPYLTEDVEGIRFIAEEIDEELKAMIIFEYNREIWNILKDDNDFVKHLKNLIATVVINISLEKGYWNFYFQKRIDNKWLKA